MSNQNNSIVAKFLETAIDSTDTFAAKKGSGQPNGDLEARTHHFFSIEFTDGSGNSVTPGAGSWTVTVKTSVNPNLAAGEAVPDAAGVDATVAQATFSVAGDIEAWVVTTAGITTATHYILRVSSHRN